MPESPALSFIYREGKVETLRRVYPRRMMYGVPVDAESPDNHWYLIAWDYDRHKDCFFRLDRISQIGESAICTEEKHGVPA